jgi:hypothetical protein
MIYALQSALGQGTKPIRKKASILMAMTKLNHTEHVETMLLKSGGGVQ